MPQNNTHDDFDTQVQCEEVYPHEGDHMDAEVRDLIFADAEKAQPREDWANNQETPF